MNRVLRIILFVTLPLVFSCKAKKHAPVAAKTGKCNLVHRGPKSLAALATENEAAYKYFSGKIKTNVIFDEKGTDFTVALRMMKDSIIWASISPALGLEVVRFMADRDSVKFIDRIHRTYFTGSYDTLSSWLKTEIDLELLQSLLVGNSVEFYMDDEKLRSGIDSCRYVLGTIRKRKLRKVMAKGKELREPAQNIWLDSTFKITRVLFREFDTGREFDARFNDFQYPEMEENSTDAKHLVPHDLNFKIKADKIILIQLRYSKTGAGKELSFPFSIPDNYDRIEKK